MAWKMMTIFGFLALVAVGAAFLVQAEGWVSWSIPMMAFVLAGVVAAFIIRRRRGTQTPATMPFAVF